MSLFFILLLPSSPIQVFIECLELLLRLSGFDHISDTQVVIFNTLMWAYSVFFLVSLLMIWVPSTSCIPNVTALPWRLAAYSLLHLTAFKCQDVMWTVSMYVAKCLTCPFSFYSTATWFHEICLAPLEGVLQLCALERSGEKTAIPSCVGAS